MPAIFIYVTVPSEAEAHKIAEAVVAECLAACANIVPGMKSVYRWQGKFEQGQETAIIFKTRDTLYQDVEARVKELHSADIPCIVAWPLTGGNEDFMQWINAETNK